MKSSKILLLVFLLSAGFIVSCSLEKKEENMKKAALAITDDFTSGNIDGFVAALDTSVRSQYPADQVLAAYQAISMIMGGPEKTERDVNMSMVENMPVASVTVKYQGGRIAYQSAFNDKGKVIAFAPVPLDADIVYQEEDIIVTDSVPAQVSPEQ